MSAEIVSVLRVDALNALKEAHQKYLTGDKSTIIELHKVIDSVYHAICAGQATTTLSLRQCCCMASYYHFIENGDTNEALWQMTDFLEDGVATELSLIELQCWGIMLARFN